MKQCCPTCGHSIAKRKVTFDRILLSSLVKAYNHAMKMRSANGREWGNIISISDLSLTNPEYTKMNNLVRFGLAYKEDGWTRGSYGLPLSRIWKFLNGEWTVASFCLVNPLDKRHHEMSEERIFVNEVPSASKVRAKFGDTFTEYQFNEDGENLEAEELADETKPLSFLF